VTSAGPDHGSLVTRDCLLNALLRSPGNGQTIFKIRLCVEVEDCGAWKEWP
jgi:hypothetical protein